MLSPALTSVRQPKYELGASAAELLLEETVAARSTSTGRSASSPSWSSAPRVVALRGQAVPVEHYCGSRLQHEGAAVGVQAVISVDEESRVEGGAFAVIGVAP